MVRQCPVVDFDHHSAEFAADQVGVLQDLLRRGPVVYTANYGGFYFVTGYDEVAAILADTKSFSAEKGPDNSGGPAIPPLRHQAEDLIPGGIDPPRHSIYRRAILPNFTKAVMLGARPMIERIVSERLDQIENMGDFDIVTDLGSLVPSAFVIELLGLPENEREDFRRATEAKYGIGQGAGGGAADVAELVAWMDDRILAAVADKRVKPTDDVISSLVHRPEHFSDDELRGILLQLIVGGIHTTSALISSSLLYLHEDRQLRARLIGDPELLPEAIEEFLRISSPNVGLARTVVERVEIGGVVMSPGERVLVCFPGAHLDERHFRNPTQLEITRKERNLGFGVGAHRCIGDHMVRIEMEVLLRMLLERIPDYTVYPELAQWVPFRGVLNMWASMPASTTSK